LADRTIIAVIPVGGHVYYPFAGTGLKQHHNRNEQNVPGEKTSDPGKKTRFLNKEYPD
jgi:hypothetical protein